MTLSLSRASCWCTSSDGMCVGANTGHLEGLGGPGGPMQGEEECVAHSSIHCCCQGKWRTPSSMRQVSTPQDQTALMTAGCSISAHLFHSNRTTEHCNGKLTWFAVTPCMSLLHVACGFFHSTLQQNAAHGKSVNHLYCKGKAVHGRCTACWLQAGG